MAPLSSVVLAVCTAALVLADAYLLFLRWAATSPPPVAWGQFASAVALQVFMLLLLVFYLLWLGSRPMETGNTSGPMEVLRAKFWPAGALVVIGVLSFDLMQRSLLCGGASIPTVRGEMSACSI